MRCGSCLFPRGYSGSGRRRGCKNLGKAARVDAHQQESASPPGAAGRLSAPLLQFLCTIWLGVLLKCIDSRCFPSVLELPALSLPLSLSIYSSRSEDGYLDFLFSCFVLGGWGVLVLCIFPWEACVFVVDVYYASCTGEGGARVLFELCLRSSPH